MYGWAGETPLNHLVAVRQLDHVSTLDIVGEETPPFDKK